MSEMYNPPHPGSILREDILPVLELTVTKAASQLGISRAMFSRILNEHAGISPEMALRLEEWLNERGYRGGRADQWAAMQLDYDMWHARQARSAA